MSLSVVSATPGFLDALGARLVSGRTFIPEDERFRSEVLLLSESAARLYAPGEDLVGQPLPVRLPPIADYQAAPTVLGVVRDVKYEGLELPPAAALYLPWHARPTGKAFLAVRSTSKASTLATVVRDTLRELSPRTPISRLGSFDGVLRRSISERRLRVVPALGFAGVALAVALTGVFALLARAAAERRREFAVRVALGASAHRVRGLLFAPSVGPRWPRCGVGDRRDARPRWRAREVALRCDRARPPDPGRGSARGSGDIVAGRIPAGPARLSRRARRAPTRRVRGGLGGTPGKAPALPR